MAIYVPPERTKATDIGSLFLNTLYLRFYKPFFFPDLPRMIPIFGAKLSPAVLNKCSTLEILTKCGILLLYSEKGKKKRE